MQALPFIAGFRALLILVALPLVSSALPAQEQEIESQPAIQARLADQTLLLDIIRQNGEFVAVGTRGHVLLSADGQDWRQAESVPVQAALTRVTHFGRRLWAVGHDATIISSTDREIWHVQHFDPEAQEPLLDVLFLNPNKGFAIGAYGRFMTTADGGIHWNTERISDRVTSESIDWADLARRQGDIETLPEGDPEQLDSQQAEAFVNKGCYEFGECHLNAIVQFDSDRLMITAERGYGFRSSDGGETWEAFRFPYTGSLFGLVRQEDCILAFGLRGHVLKSCDFGEQWTDVPVEGQQSLMGATVLADGTAVLVGAGATLLRISPDGQVRRDADQLGGDYAAAIANDDGTLIVVGEDGVEYE